MTWRDKLEIGLKEDAPFRKDNLPESQVRGPETPNGPGRSPEVTSSRTDGTDPASSRGFDDLETPFDHWQDAGGAVGPPVSRPADRTQE